MPLVVPLTLVRHHVRMHDVEYLRGQSYLDPHPRDLATWASDSKVPRRAALARPAPGNAPKP